MIASSQSLRQQIASRSLSHPKHQSPKIVHFSERLPSKRPAFIRAMATKQPPFPNMPPAQMLVQAPPAPIEINKDILLIYLPGAMLSGKDYQATFNSLQQLQSYHQQEAGINLFLVCPPINWMALASLPAAAVSHDDDGGGGMLDRVNAAGDVAFNAALEAAVNVGFKPENQGESIYVAMHSVAAMWAMQAAVKRSAGVIYIGGSILTQPGFVWPGVLDFPQPMLHIWGSMDGQYRSTRAALVADDVAQSIGQLGPIRAAAQKALLLVPGMNHAQQSNGKANVARGDLLPDLDLDEAGAQIASALSAFIVANSASGLEVKNKALIALKEMTHNAIDAMAPYNTALGRLAGSSFARGAEAAGPPSQEFIAHPGEIAIAKAFCEYAQRRCLQTMKEGDPMISITAIVHTSLDNFLLSQPRMYSPITTSTSSIDASIDSMWVLQVHVFLHREWLEPSVESWLKNSSPEYYLKLKNGVAVAQEMKRRKEEDAGEEGGGNDVSAAELHSELYALALNEVSPVYRDMYTKRGRVLEFGEDRDVSREIENPIDYWMVNNGVVGGVLTSPKVSSEMICVETGSNGGGGRGKSYGNHYIKVKSKAWFHEWIMIDGLREG